jgi:hypothetical protein
MHNDKDQRDIPIPPIRIWILGAGRFGRIAVARISNRIQNAVITVVDDRPFSMDRDGITKICEDGIQWLNRSLFLDAAVDMIVPAIPVHVVAEWLKINLLQSYEIESIEISDAWLSRLPNAVRGAAGLAFVSHADFICPDNCPEPKMRCTHTGKPRPMDLFRLLAKRDNDPVLPIVIRSRQLLPGVGGLYPSDLMSALDTVCQNSHRPMMIATACRCHGVVEFMRLKKMGGCAGLI